MLKDGRGTTAVAIVTRFYRSPEILLGNQHYSLKIDVWSCGCILGEHLQKKVLFAQADMTYVEALLGSATYAEMEELRPGSVKFGQAHNRPAIARDLTGFLCWQENLAIRGDCKAVYDLMAALLQYSATARLTAQQGLAHEMFRHYDLKAGFKVDDRWAVVSKLSEGLFGSVYMVTDTEKKFAGEMALKLESLEAQHQVLKIEVAVLKAMTDEKHACKLFASGRNNCYNFMVISLLGPALSDLKRKLPGYKMTLGTTVRIIFQCLKAVRDMHNCGWLHRDIKPSNFCIGSNPSNRRPIFICDFGLARRFRNKTDRVKPMRDWVGFRGNMRYCSINAHKRMELGRHDDMISLLYMFVEFIKGVLPWGMLRNHEAIMKSKIEQGTKIYEGLPPSIVPVHEYLYSLAYDDPPRYSMLEEVLLNITYSMAYQKQLLNWEKDGAMRTPSGTDEKELRFSDEDEEINELPCTM